MHPTRSNLLALRERRKAVRDSVHILKSRRKALMQEFLRTTAPLLRTRKEIAGTYRKALGELALALGQEGEAGVESIALLSLREELAADIALGSIWGLGYKEVKLRESPLRAPEERGYDYLGTTPRLEEATHLFEEIVRAVMDVAAYESKLKRLGEEIARSTHRIRMLEERVEPSLSGEIKGIAEYLEERERETHYRLRLRLRRKGARG
ncbi:MAG: V-type ATP synthase subunit D [Nitrospirota bacterium]